LLEAGKSVWGALVWTGAEPVKERGLPEEIDAVKEGEMTLTEVIEPDG
jgi:hypothetical protein